MRLTSEARVQEDEGAPSIDASSCRCTRRRSSSRPGRRRPIRTLVDRVAHFTCRESMQIHVFSLSVRRSAAAIPQPFRAYGSSLSLPQHGFISGTPRAAQESERCTGAHSPYQKVEAILGASREDVQYARREEGSRTLRAPTVCCTCREYLIEASSASAVDVGESYVQALPRIDSSFEQWVGTSSPAREQARHLPSRSDNAATPLSPREGSKGPERRKGRCPADPTLPHPARFFGDHCSSITVITAWVIVSGPLTVWRFFRGPA